MPDNKRMTTRLKELFERPEIFVLAGGMNPMGAKMAEVLGFEAFYMSGGIASSPHDPSARANKVPPKAAVMNLSHIG